MGAYRSLLIRYPNMWRAYGQSDIMLTPPTCNMNSTKKRMHNANIVKSWCEYTLGISFNVNTFHTKPDPTCITQECSKPSFPVYIEATWTSNRLFIILLKIQSCVSFSFIEDCIYSSIPCRWLTIFNVFVGGCAVQRVSDYFLHQFAWWGDLVGSMDAH